MHICVTQPQWVNTLRPRQNGRLFADDIFACNSLNENVWISVKISLKFILNGSINNIPAFVQIMAWRRPGNKPISEPMIVRLPTHICVTRPRWVNTLRLTQNGRHFQIHFFNESHCISILISLMFVITDNKSALFQVMAWHRTDDKPLSEPMMT